MQVQSTNSNSLTPQFKARLILNADEGLLNKKQVLKLMGKAREIGIEKDVFNFTLKGDIQSYSASWINKLHAYKQGRPAIFMNEKVGITPFSEGTPFEFLNRKLDTLASVSRRMRGY